MKRFQVNILTRYEFSLFTQHVPLHGKSSAIEFVENGDNDREWDLVIVFDGLSSLRTMRVRNGGLVFIAGEPPDAIVYSNQFLRQFDLTFCAHPYARGLATNRPNQYYNNWHFGYDQSSQRFRWSYEELIRMDRPEKTRDMSVIMSSLAYMPNHLKRRQFLKSLQDRYGDRVDVYGRGHRFIPYKDDALLPYRYHVCLENCVVPDIWTEKLADPLLGWSVPVYGGCPNIDQYFSPQSIVRIEINNVEGALAIIGQLIDEGDAGYRRRIVDLENARRQILDEHNIFCLVAQLINCTPTGPSQLRYLRPNEQTSGHKVSDLLLRTRRFAYRHYFLMTRGKGF